MSKWLKSGSSTRNFPEGRYELKSRLEGAKWDMEWNLELEGALRSEMGLGEAGCTGAGDRLQKRDEKGRGTALADLPWKSFLCQEDRLRGLKTVLLIQPNPLPLPWASLHLNPVLSRVCPTLCDPSLPGSSVHAISQQEYWRGLPCPPPRDLPNQGIEAASPALAGGFFTTEPPGKPSL